MIIALTGGIGSGRFYVCKLLTERGISVYDCDAHAKELIRTSQPLQQQLSALVGEGVFRDGVLQKAVLVAYLLQGEAHVQAVNAMIHSAVAHDFEQSGQSWLESAILFDSGFDKRTHIDKVICVMTPGEVCIRRVMTRDGISREKTLEWITCQLSQEEVLERSDYEIINDGICPLAPRVDHLLSIVSG